MYTVQYKSFYINGYFDKPEVSVIYPNGGLFGKYNSAVAAKFAITKYIKNF